MLGFSAIQLTRTQEPNLTSLAAANLFTVAPASGGYPIPGDATARAAIGYLHGNCGHCHNPTGHAHPDVPDMTLRVGTAETALTVDALQTYVTTVDKPLVIYDAPGYVRIKPGIYFTDDPAFKGKPRELVAQDYVYAFKRFFDPRWKAPAFPTLAEQKIRGAAQLRERALKEGQKFDYDAPIEGLLALDRYTLQFRLEEPRPRFLQVLAAGDLYGAVAREVVEAYGEAIVEHPVGTGPFKLAEWRRSSRIVLARNPTYRERFYDAEPNPDDAEGQALLRRFRGRRLPMIDRVEISIIEETQPRWLSFLNKQLDLLERLPYEFANIAIPNGRLAPNLARRGIQMYRMLNPDVTITLFNMDDPVIGGYAPERIALRRAIRCMPRARVTVTTAGSPSGLAATASAIAVVAVVTRSPPRSRLMVKIRPTTAPAIAASRLPRRSSCCCSGVADSASSASRPASRPISVCMPVVVVSASTRPRVTTVFM